MNALTNRNFALVSAVIYLAAGVLGFFVTGFDDFAGDTDERLVLLALNPLHNIVHLVLGTAWAVAATSERNARIGNVGLGIGLLAAFVLGVVGGAQFLNIDGLAEPDNYLHLIWGGLSLMIGLRGRAASRSTV